MPFAATSQAVSACAREAAEQVGTVFHPVVKPESDGGGDVGPDHPFQILFRNAPLAKQLPHLLNELTAAGHLHILTAFDDFFRVVHGAPVTHHASPESELAAQQFPDDTTVLTGPHPVELVIGGHHIGHTGFDTGAERRHIDLVQRSFIDQ